MHIAWKKIGKLGLTAAKAVFPAVAAVEAGVLAVKDSESKLDAGEQLAVAGLELAEEVSDTDLLKNDKVRSTYRALMASYVSFMDALAEAKAAKVDPPAGPI